MSPEQLRSTATVDHRTDVWSLGATMFELLSGGTPYRAGQTLPQLIAEILERPAPRLADDWHDIPPELSAIVSRCMAKDREQRFANAAELAIALLPFAPKRVRANVERAIAVTQASTPSSESAKVWTDPPPANRASTGDPGAAVSIPGTLRSATSERPKEAIENLDTLAAPTKSVSGEKKRSRFPAVAAAVVGVAGVLALLWHLAGSGPVAVPPPSASTLPGTVQRSDPEPVPPAPAPSAISAPPEVEARVPSPPEPMASTAPSGSVARPPPRPGAPAHHAAAPSSAPASSLDIRMER